MQGLPLGVPKLIVTTVASGRSVFEPYVGTSDMTLMHSVSDILGVDAVSKSILTRAAAGITAMIEVQLPIEAVTQGVVGVTMLGLTTSSVMLARQRLEAHGCDVVPFHANGTGGRCMERLVEEGIITAVLDLSTQELVGHVCGGLFDAGPQRLTVAAKVGVPQVVVPGGTDYVVLGPMSSLSTEQRSRPVVVHNPNITLVRTSAEEMAEVGRVLATRLNVSAAPVAVVVPRRGFSQADIEGGAFYDPEADHALVSVLEDNLNCDVQFIEVDEHVNSERFGNLVAEKLIEVMGR
jgi:uncharacterized protein (UPF0261 family)